MALAPSHGPSAVEPDTIVYSKDDWIETSAGDKFSRKTTLCGLQNIRLSGKTVIMPQVMIRGDLAPVNLGRYCVVKQGAVIRPPHKRFKGALMYFKITIGDHVTIEEDSIVSAASIGSHVHIGKNCVISRRAVLMDCCKVLDNSVVGPGAVVPPFAVVSGVPARIVDQLPDAIRIVHEEATALFYASLEARTGASAVASSPAPTATNQLAS